MCQRIIYSVLLFFLSLQLIGAQGISVKKLGFSEKEQSEIAPVFKDSVLYFSSNKNINWLKKATDQNNENFYNLFSVRQAADSSWQDVEQYQADYFSEFHTGSIAFFEPRNEIYFTEVHYKDKKRFKGKDQNLLGVFQAQEDKDSYTRAKSLPFNSRRSYNTGHPTLSPDGQLLFFVSDKEDGYGETDIYMSERTGEEWGPAVNMGKLINTPAKELFPFYHPNGKLYFASNGLGGEGGFDIFYTYRTNEGWVKPIAMNNQINSAANELSCYIFDDEQGGYFASDRDGDDDLFEFRFLFPVFGAGNKQKENTFRYQFFDEMGGKGEGPLKYVWHFGDGGIAEGDTVIHKFRQPGTYHVQSFLVDTVENVELFVLKDFHHEVKKKIQVYIKCPDEVKLGELQTLDATESNLGDFTPNGFYWELPDGSKQKGETIQFIFRTKGKHIVKCGTISKDDPQHKMCTYKEINVIE
ncbi:MAG: PKD domain-containing protein [Carboxylicivirga sp.]|jgi:hypothetical protein|nr:PKD domain-containing protein [Carboxylicivirga sp.]